MEKINIAEILKDCPKGMELDCTMWDNVRLSYVSEGNAYPIKTETPDGLVSLTKYGCYSNNKHSKCVIFPKGKTTWEGFQRLFKNGDVVVTTLGNIAIIKEPIGTDYLAHVILFNDDTSFYDDTTKVCVARFATEEEKEKLFQAIKDNGYKWDEETKTLENVVVPKFKVGDKIKPKGSDRYHIIKNIEFDRYILDNNQFLRFIDEHDFELVSNKLIEPKFKVGDKVRGKDSNNIYTISGITPTGYKLTNGESFDFKYEDCHELVPSKFDITTLKPFESKVLVRDDGYSIWQPSVWGLYDKGHRFPYVTTGCRYRQCVPYEGNEHLLGKTDDCDVYYKVW